MYFINKEKEYGTTQYHSKYQSIQCHEMDE